MGSDGLQVPLDQLAAMATQWQGLGAQLTATTPPSPGQPFQPTAAAVSSIDALISAAGATLAARIQETATGMTTAGANYGTQEATNARDMSDVTKVTVV
ncbi:hypothetical protein BN000_02190 [Mycobacterium europaeum]|uniref:PE family protein n=1 Tax=Mycobacterium europaeum TaxID=761804 RepID=A0A0U1DAR7_9MYCO|nr:hypothetical protein [Mycobacterium europaeum]CQD10605.1 hypothetical protein BN000_02190 [Mycobacterium europaeum]